MRKTRLCIQSKRRQNAVQSVPHGICAPTDAYEFRVLQEDFVWNVE